MANKHQLAQDKPQVNDSPKSIIEGGLRRHKLKQLRLNSRMLQKYPKTNTKVHKNFHPKFPHEQTQIQPQYPHTNLQIPYSQAQTKMSHKQVHPQPQLIK